MLRILVIGLCCSVVVSETVGAETTEPNNSGIEASIDSLLAIRNAVSDSLSGIDKEIGVLRGELALQRVVESKTAPMFTKVCSVGGYAYELPDPTSGRREIPAKSSVRVFGYDDPYLAIEYDGKTVFIEPPYLDMTPELEEMVDTAEQAKIERRKRAEVERLAKIRDESERINAAAREEWKQTEEKRRKEEEQIEQAREKRLVQHYGKIVASRILAGALDRDV